MDPAAFLVLIILLAGVVLYVSAPLRDRQAHRPSEEGAQRSFLMAERERIIAALQELDFDFQLGKIPPDEYPAQRAELMKKGADVLRQLDLWQPPSTRSAGEAAGDVHARLEQAVAARRADGSPPAAPLSDDEIESMLAARRKEHRAKASGFCPRCGKPVATTDRFCPNCGKALM